MTPNVQKAVLMYPERAAEYHWFDLGMLPEDREFSHEEIVSQLLKPMPFDMCAIAGVDTDGFAFAVLVTKGKTTEHEDALFIETTVEQEILNGRGHTWPAFWIRPSQLSPNDGVDLMFVDPKNNTDEQALQASRLSGMVVGLMMEQVHRENHSYPVYTATANTNNAKRIRQGKKPMFDWHTVLIEPPRQKMPDQGGTHATPRLHDVRGHWVNRNGKRYWRKAHQRGDASLGVVFHDYKIKEKQDELGQ